MGIWFTEKQTSGVGITCKINKTLYAPESTGIQEMAVVETEQFGKMLILDDTVQTTIGDEFVYHEMIAHVPLFTHPNPKKVLVIGGGDGGTIREIVKHPSVEEAHLVEIDGSVIEVSKKYLPEISCQLDNPKVKIIITDGIEYMKSIKGEYDVIIVDSPDPVGPAEGLFKNTFYRDIYHALKEDGLFVAQTESPFYHEELISRVTGSIHQIFPITKLYLASIPTYPSGLWSFTMGSKRYDPLDTPQENFSRELKTRYYTPNFHKAVFALPKFVEDMVK